MISIIIPTLNEEQYLPRCLDSIKNQDSSDYEIIVADAGSKDATCAIAKSFGCRVVLGGLPAVGRNSGAQAARGSILLFLDSDTVLPPHFLSSTVTEFTTRRLGIAGFKIVLQSGNLFDRAMNYIFNVFVHAVVSFSPHACIATMATKKDHDTINGFDESVTFFEDLWYARMMAKVTKYGYINQAVYVSDRRYRSDGWFTYVKYVVAEFYTIFIDPIRSDIFRYKFNHYKKDDRVL